MIGEFKIIGDRCYVKMNKGGILEKMPKLKWYWILYFAFKQAIKGHVSIKEIRGKAYFK